MKKVIMAVFVMALILCCTSFVQAKDIMINKEIKNITFKNDKNGNQYARIFVAGTATLNGVSYQKDIAVMAFGDNVAKLKSYKKGQTIKLIASEKDYKGSPSYTVVDIIK